MLVIKSFEAQINAWKEQSSVQSLDGWCFLQVRFCVANFSFLGLPPREAEYTKLISSLYYNYAILVLNSFGLQNALERSTVDIGHFFARCHSAATACAKLVRDELSPRGYMQHAPDAHFVFTSYAVLSLLKVRL